jgi:hypothetical protein
MTEMQDIDAAGGAREEVQPNYTGAIYGSLLAASVVVGGAGENGLPPLQLATLLVATGVVFWLAHAYARLVGERTHVVVNPREIRHVARHEWPLLGAALPPAAAALLLGLLGVGQVAVAWTALIVAIAGQVGWATVAAIRSGAPRRLVLLSALVNFLLGLVIVLLKSALYH